MKPVVPSTVPYPDMRGWQRPGVKLRRQRSHRVIPIIRGWATYHRHVVAKECFATIDHHIWHLLWRWARRRHPAKGAKWVLRKYFHRDDGLAWAFAAKGPDDGQSPRLRLPWASATASCARKPGRTARLGSPEIVHGLAALAGGPHIIDGEACVLREDGTSDFNLLQERARKRRWYAGAPPLTLCVFDLLVHDGIDLMERPLVERKEALADLVANLPKTAVLFVGGLPAEADLFRAMVDAGIRIEGVMAKRKDSTYVPGLRSPAWRKIKRAGWQEGRVWRASPMNL